MVLGCEQSYPPGKAISSDRSCGNSGDGFCSFMDRDAVGSDSVSEDMFICPGCNEEMGYGDFEHVSLNDVYASRDKQDPGWR